MYMYLWKLRVHVAHDQRVCLCFTRGLLLFTVYLCFTRGLLFIIVLAVNSKTNNRSWFRKNVLIGQFPSKSVKDFRKIGWVSIPSKSIKVLWQSFWCRFTRSKNFVKVWSCKRALIRLRIYSCTSFLNIH